MTDTKEHAAVMTTIYREQIEAGETKWVLKFLESLGLFEPVSADLETLRSLQSKIGILIDGYNDDPRELFQIPEVRSFFQELHEFWPYGLYFFSRDTNTLQLLVLCHVTVKIEPQAGGAMLRVQTDQVVEFIKAAAPPNLDLTERLGWTPALAGQFLGEIGALFGAAKRPAPSTATETAGDKRQRHTEFVESERAQLAEFARSGYAESGRGAILLGPPEAGNTGCQLIFASQQSLLNTEGFNDYQKLHQMVGSYDPEKQFVICFIEPNSMDAYGVKIDSPRPAAKAATTPEDISKFNKLLMPLHDQFAELGRQGYMEQGRGAVVFMLDDYDDLSPGKTAVKYFTLDHLESVESFAGYKSLIKQVSQYDPEMFTILCVCDPQSTRWLKLSIKPKSSPEAEPKQELTTA